MTATSMDKGRASVFVKTLAFTCAYVLAISMAYRIIAAKTLVRRTLSLGIAMSSVQTVCIVALAIFLLLRKILNQIRERRRQMLRPQILSELAAHVTGSDRTGPLGRFYDDHPGVVDDCVEEVARSVAGEARDRLLELAIELGLVERWETQYRKGGVAERQQAVHRLGLVAWLYPTTTLLQALEDEENSIRLEALRAIMRFGGRPEIELAFKSSLSQPLFVRAIFADELHPHALVLCDGAIPEALASPDSTKVLSTLDMIRAWQEVLPLSGLPRLLLYGDPGVRAAAFQTLPYGVATPQLDALVRAGLSDDNPGVRSGAAFAAGRLKVRSVFPALERLLREPNLEVGLAAAYAMAGMGPEGMKILEEEICSPNSATAGAALEALERARTERHDYAGV